jgi:hypothetical protein
LHPLLREAGEKFGVQRVDEAGVEALGYPGTWATHLGETREILDSLYSDKS